MLVWFRKARLTPAPSVGVGENQASYCFPCLHYPTVERAEGSSVHSPRYTSMSHIAPSAPACYHYFMIVSCSLDISNLSNSFSLFPCPPPPMPHDTNCFCLFSKNRKHHIKNKNKSNKIYTRQIQRSNITNSVPFPSKPVVDCQAPLRGRNEKHVLETDRQLTYDFIVYYLFQTLMTEPVCSISIFIYLFQFIRHFFSGILSCFSCITQTATFFFIHHHHYYKAINVVQKRSGGRG